MIVEAQASQRAVAAVTAVLPPRTNSWRDDAGGETMTVNGHDFRVIWVGEGRPDTIRRVIDAHSVEASDIVVARRLSVPMRDALAAAGINWVDESGAARIVAPGIIVALTGTPSKPTARPSGWTPSVLAVAEALLCGANATASSMVQTTGLSMGSCVNALRTLARLHLLEASAERGRDSARRVADHDRLLDAYSSAAPRLVKKLAVEVGVTWQNVTEGVVTFAEAMERAGIAYAVTGAAAASLLAPYLTVVNRAEVYVARDNPAGLVAAGAVAGLRPVAGGRLTLRPFPTVATNRLARTTEGLRLAPWPRVYVDLLHAGVRGEDAAEHLKEVHHGR